MTIKKRLIINFTGYEGLHPKAVRIRHRKMLSDFDRLWHTTSKASPMSPTKNGCASMTVVTTGDDDGSGHNWKVETKFCQFGTADIFDDYAKRSVPLRLFTGSRAFINIVLTGTLFRYALTSWRFVLFFLWPFLLTLALCLATFLIAGLPVMTGLPLWNLLWSMPMSVLIAAGLIRVPGEKLFLSYLLDDWAAAYDRIYNKNAALIERRQYFADLLTTKLRETNADEVLLVGHSLGTVPAIEALAQVWRTEPELISKQPVSLLAAGSCLMMIALHPKAGSLREDVRLVVQDSSVLWCEFQALTDIIHFYGSDPARDLKINTENSPIIRQIRFKNIHSAGRYQRAKGNFFKMHLLYMLGAQKRNPYDMGMFQQGPFPFSDLVNTYQNQPAPLGSNIKKAA